RCWAMPSPIWPVPTMPTFSIATFILPSAGGLGRLAAHAHRDGPTSDPPKRGDADRRRAERRGSSLDAGIVTKAGTAPQRGAAPKRVEGRGRGRCPDCYGIRRHFSPRCGRIWFSRVVRGGRRGCRGPGCPEAPARGDKSDILRPETHQTLPIV